MVGSIAGAVLLAMFIWGLCYCVRQAPQSVGVDKEPPRSFVQAFPAATPMYLGASVAPTIIDGPSAELGGITYTSGPSIYGSQNNVRTPMGVSNPPPKISIRRSRPGGGSYGRNVASRAGPLPSITPLAPNPTNGILVNRNSEPRTEGSLMGQLLDAEFYPDIDV